MECDECEQKATYHLCTKHTEIYDRLSVRMAQRLKNTNELLKSVDLQLSTAIKYLEKIGSPLARAALEEIGETNESN